MRLTEEETSEELDDDIEVTEGELGEEWDLVKDTDTGVIINYDENGNPTVS